MKEQYKKRNKRSKNNKTHKFKRNTRIKKKKSKRNTKRKKLRGGSLLRNFKYAIKISSSLAKINHIYDLICGLDGHDVIQVVEIEPLMNDVYDEIEKMKVVTHMDDEELISLITNIKEQVEKGKQVYETDDILVLPENYIQDYIDPLSRLLGEASRKIEKYTGSE